MDITFTAADLIRFGIIIYVVAWFGLVCFLSIYSNRKSQNVHKVAMWCSIIPAIRHWGWIVGLAVSLLLLWILPDVYVVTQNPDRIKKEKKKYASRYGWTYADTTFTVKETFFVDHYYVPFAYREKRCNAFNSYLLNETDSILVLYSTVFFNGQFTGVSAINEFKIIQPGSFQIFDEYIHNMFDTPMESNFYIPKDRKNKRTTELTITLMSDAFYDTERIRKRINDRNYLMDACCEEDDDEKEISIKVRELLLKKTKELQDVKQGTH